MNLLFGENPNRAVREWTKPFHEAGIQTHMLDRALNGLRMSPVPADVRKLFYKVKKAQGTDITRTFCGLNDVRNIAPSITYAKEAGMISQCSLVYHPFADPHGRVLHQYGVRTYQAGADEICIKDMAGIVAPFHWARSWPISKRHILKFLFSIIVMPVPVSTWQASSKYAKPVATTLT